MARFKQVDRKKARHAQPGENRLAELAREWFAEAGETSAHEDAGMTAGGISRTVPLGTAPDR
jgi:hypothetical protein